MRDEGVNLENEHYRDKGYIVITEIAVLKSTEAKKHPTFKTTKNI